MSDQDPKEDGQGPHALAQPSVTEHGGRVELRLTQARSTQTSICYFARFFYEGRTQEGWLYIDAPESAGKVPELRLDADGLPDWLVNFTQTLMRTSARSALSSGAPFAECSWPRRLTRWRKDPNE